MENWQDNPNVALLTSKLIPELDNEQLERFTPNTIHTQVLGHFDSAQAVELLNSQEGKRVLGADFGGDKGSIRLFEVQHGILIIVKGYTDDIQGNDGQGYVDSLKKAATYAEINNIPFGISWGGPMEGSKVIFHPKAKIFMAELESQFESDLKRISPSITAALNDGPAGLLSAAVEAFRQFKASTVVFAINGGGLGLGVLKDNTIYATEGGHIEGNTSLNIYNQVSQCGVFNAAYTCIEHLGANKAGIEVQWQAAHGGEYMRARDIEDRYKEGDQLAGDLYEHSAYVVAHMIYGSAQAFGIYISSPEVAIVCHGGAFKFPYYGDRVRQILSKAVDQPDADVKLIMTKDYTNSSSNACLDGAAIAAITVSD